MKSLSIIPFVIATAFNLAGPGAGRAQPGDASKEIEASLHQYYASMKTRDIEGLRSALASRFIVIEAGRDKAKTQTVDVNNPKELLPPEGNKDWQGIELSTVRASVSSTHPTVATASFTLIMPLDEKRVAGMQSALKARPEAFNDVRRAAISRMIADRAIKSEMFAMLARQDGGWKIVCLSFPQ